MADRPKFDNAPGLTLEEVKDGWIARWRCRTDIRARGFMPKSRYLWRGIEPTAHEREFVSEQCQWLQDEMLDFGRGGPPEEHPFDGTLGGLIDCYGTDPDSTYRQLRYKTRVDTDRRLRRVAREHRATKIEDINGRVLRAWHKAWLGPDGKHIAMAHSLIGVIRTVIRFGKTILEDEECTRVASLLSDMKFEQAKAPPQWMTAEQAVAIRRAAHARGWHSIALAEALQFELLLRQKDVIGEWVPDSEPGISDVTHGSDKWLRGLRWDEIHGPLLRHTTSKKGKELVFDLRLAPMVMEELTHFGEQPASGPMVVNEYDNRPFEADEFRRKFRIVARDAGVPNHIKNMDSRSGGITEATTAGAPLEHVRHAATHSDIAMTQRYSRGGAEKIESVMKARVSHRNKMGTEDPENR